MWWALYRKKKPQVKGERGSWNAFCLFWGKVLFFYHSWHQTWNSPVSAWVLKLHETIGMFYNADLRGLYFIIFFGFYLITCLFVCMMYVYEHRYHSSHVAVRQLLGINSLFPPLYGFHNQIQVSRLVPQATLSVKSWCQPMRDYFKWVTSKVTFKPKESDEVEPWDCRKAKHSSYQD